MGHSLKYYICLPMTCPPPPLSPGPHPRPPLSPQALILPPHPPPLPQALIHGMPPGRLAVFPQLFWASLALLHTEYVHMFCHVLQLLATVLGQLQLHTAQVGGGLGTLLGCSVRCMMCCWCAPPA